MNYGERIGRIAGDDVNQEESKMAVESAFNDAGYKAYYSSEATLETPTDRENKATKRQKLTQFYSGLNLACPQSML